MIEVDGELGLVDAGLPGLRRRILSAVEWLGRRPSDVRHILVTHHHVDHTGSLATLVAETGARVHAHPGDTPIIRDGGERPKPNPTGPYGVVLLPIMAPLLPDKAEPAGVDNELDDGEEIPVAGGLRAVHTPGHTSGHMSFLLSREGVLFVGDAAAHAWGRVDLNYVNDDIDRTRQSFRRLARMDFEVACFGHGRPIKRAAAERFRQMTDRLSG